jgi:hypothetical protein
MIHEYQTHSTLNPKLWDGDRLQPKLRVGFMKIAKAFYDFLEVDTDILDVIIIGSSANYNWTEHSDIDLHVVINYSAINENMLLVQNYMHAKKSIWNVNYPLTYKGLPVELYAQDSNDVLNSTVGIYSVLHGKWINKPSAETISIDDDAIEQKADPYEYEIDSLKESDPQIEFKLKNILMRLQRLRQTGLDAEGEYSVENMAFKHLRNRGYIERLKQLQKKVSLGKLALEQVLNEQEDSVMEDVLNRLIPHITKQNLLNSTGWSAIIMKTGGVVDPMGQWNHPGKCTMIPTTDGRITMQNVPHNVLGIDDTGHCQLMKPEQHYQYPGRNVFEIPHTAQYQTMIMQLQNALKNGSQYAK